ncbi:MAG: hypothetical protein AB1505_12440 [Candidatus Latescibacterota bacterium]
MRPPNWRLVLLGLAAWAVRGAAQEGDLGPRNAGLGLGTYPSSPPLRAFLNRQTWPAYWNYGQFDYSPNTLSVRSLEIYDRLGTHLFRGLPLFSWRETRSDTLGLQSSALDRERYFFTFFNNLVVASDRYNGWSFGLTVGDAIRTSLTPLTLRDPRWQGLRLDGDAGRQGFSLLLTRGSLARFSAFDARLDNSPVLAYGGHYRYQPAPVLTVAATLFNQHQVDVQSRRGSFLSGTPPYQMRSPRQITVRVQPDEPSSGSPAAVYGVVLEAEAMDPATGARRRLSSDPQAAAPWTFSPALAPRVSGGRLQDGARVVWGEEAVEYTFDLPGEVVLVAARFAVDVAGDFRVQVRQVHDFLDTSGNQPVVRSRAWPPRADPSHSQLGNPLYPYDFKPEEETPFYTVSRAEGRPGLGARRRVRIDYGIPTGRTLLGADFQVLSHELTAGGEVAWDAGELHFPFASDSLGARGRRHTTGSWAYLFTVGAPLPLGGGALEWGGEVFGMAPDYGGGYDSRRGGTVYFTDVGGARGNEAFAQEFPLVYDNDDEDEYPDDTFPDQGRFQPFVPGSYSGGRSGGVFPGLDADGDLTPDNDRDRNGVPDWTEPFLLYYSDPADFVYGIDFNNNAQPDFRENDDHPDYPIRKDQRGYHSFLSAARPAAPGQRLTVGAYRVRQIAGGGEAQALYARAQGAWTPLRGAVVEVDDDLKLVEDDIRDDVYEWVIGDTSALANANSPLVPPPPDPLVMRRSLVNTTAAHLAVHPGAGAELRLDLLHFVNRQRRLREGGVLLQDAGTFGETSLVARAHLRRSWRQFEAWAGAKAALEQGRRGPAWPPTALRFLAPMVRLSFEVMPGMSLQWGACGLPGLPMRLVDGEDPDREYEERQTVFMVTGRSEDFQGSTVSIHTGLELHRLDYDRAGPARDFDTYTVFVDLIVGN